MSWNYRLIRDKYELYIAEVYYEEDGKTTRGYIPKLDLFCCDPSDDPREEWEKLKQMVDAAFNRKILVPKDFFTEKESGE